MDKILIAGQEEELVFLFDALNGEYELVLCTTWSDAEAGLDQNVSLVICSAHFQDGRLYEFAKLAKSNPCTCHIPFYGIVVNDPDFSRQCIKSMRADLNAVKAQGAFDLAGLRRDCGDIEASAMFRTAVEGIVMESARGPRVHHPKARTLALRSNLPGSPASVRKHREVETYES